MDQVLVETTVAQDLTNRVGAQTALTTYDGQHVVVAAVVNGHQELDTGSADESSCDGQLSVKSGSSDSLKSGSIDFRLEWDDEESDTDLNGDDGGDGQGVPPPTKPIHWFDEDSAGGRQLDESDCWPSPRDSQHSSGYSSLSASRDKSVDNDSDSSTTSRTTATATTTGAAAADPESVANNLTDDDWNCDVFDPQKPYLNEPLVYPSSQRIHTPMGWNDVRLARFVPYKRAPTAIPWSGRRHEWSVTDGQFDSD